VLQHLAKFPGQEQIAPAVQEREALELGRDRWRDFGRAEPLEMMRNEGHDPMDVGVAQEGSPIK
jgi:hypothetical protein